MQSPWHCPQQANGKHTHTPKPVHEQEAITVLWKQAVHTDREVTAKRPDIIIKNKRENMQTAR